MLAFCLGQGPTTAVPAAETGDEANLIQLLQSTASAWNRGDLDAFIAPYSDDSTYMTSSGPIARDAMRARYASKYFTGGHPDQQVRFDQLVVRMLGAEHALMTGRYTLTGGNQAERTGWFSLVWTRTHAGWRILHDHSG